MSGIDVQHSWMWVILNRDRLVLSRMSQWTDEPERYMLYESGFKALEAAQAAKSIGAVGFERRFMILVEVTPCRTEPESREKMPS